MKNTSFTYEIDTGNYAYEPINNNINNKPFYYSANTEVYNNDRKYLLSNNHFNTSSSNYLNSISNNSKRKDFNIYNNTISNPFSKENINFYKNNNSKIKLTYEYKNISPIEISNKTKELINLQYQMCALNNKNKNLLFNKKRANSVNNPKPKNKNSKYFQSLKNKNNSLFPSSNINKTKNKKKAMSKTFNNSLNNRKNNSIFYNSGINRVRGNSLKQNRNNIWKNKYLKVNDDVKNIKKKIEDIKNNNKDIEKRLLFVKEKEKKNNLLYNNNKKIKHNEKLMEKYNISENIRKKQIDLIIKMQKEVNNMKEKFKC
jgi:hypothetical protein